MSHVLPTETPNVVVSNPTVRKAAGIIIGVVGLLLGTVLVVDAAAPEFDASSLTNPVSAAYLYLSSVFGLAVSVPNVPRGA